MKTKKQIVDEVMRLLQEYRHKSSYGEPLVNRDGHVHDKSAIHALLWALGAKGFPPPSKGIRPEDVLQRM